MKETIETDVALIGGGIMSATLGMLINQLAPDKSIHIFERLKDVAVESSDAWNNAGTGHAALCELNYTPQDAEGVVHIEKACSIMEQFEMSKQFWAYLIEQEKLANPKNFIRSTPHMSFVRGETDVAYLKKRFDALQKSALFQEMQYSEDPDIIKQWAPLITEGRNAEEKIAATYSQLGTDVNFGAITGALIHSLQKTGRAKLHLHQEIKKLKQQKIAACLSSLDEVIKAENQKLDLLNNHKRGLLQNLLPVGKETTPKFRFKEFEKSDEWFEDTLINLANFRRGSFPQPYGLPEWYDDENGMPFIQVFDVGEDFRLKPTTKRKISKLAAQQSVFIPKGTLIITIQGSIGRVAITQYDAYIDRTLLLFEEFHQQIDITFFAYTLFLLFEIEKQKAPGGIIKTITKEVLSSFVVKIPSIEEQRKIASCLSSLDELISAQNQKIEALQQHKKGLLQSLFPNLNEVTV